jgi:hypothetical protein
MLKLLIALSHTHRKYISLHVNAIHELYMYENVKCASEKRAFHAATTRWLRCCLPLLIVEEEVIETRNFTRYRDNHANVRRNSLHLRS